MLTRSAENAVTEIDEQLVVITRVFDAAPSLVFQAWTDPEHLARWYGPKGCTTTFHRIDIREGGGFHSCIQSPDGHRCWRTGVYREIVAPSLLVYTLTISDANGNSVEPFQVGMDPEWPRETVMTVTFTGRGGKTTVTLHQTVAETIAKRTGAQPSWIEMLDRLAEYVATDSKEKSS